MEQERILNYLQRISESDKSIEFIKQLESELQMNQEYHISIECQMAFMLWNTDLKSFSINRFKNIIRTEIENNFENYGTVFADSVGMAISFLIENHYKETDSDITDMFKMGYVYLSKHIEMFGDEMCDSFKHRAYLTDNCQTQTQALAIEFLKVYSFIPIPLTISDYYSAGKAFFNLGIKESYRECIERGAYLHNWLEDMMINGKDADEYEFTEIADLGKQRLELLNSKITDFKIFDTNKIICLIDEDLEISTSTSENRVHEDDLQYKLDWKNELKIAFQNGELFNGVSFAIYPNGNLKHETSYFNGRKSGIEKSWFEDGQIKSESECENGYTEGNSKGWHPNGKLAYDWLWENRQPKGAWKTYYDDGRIKTIKKFENGKQISIDEF